MKCVLCHRNCRNSCSRGNHGWCANCRDTSGYLECSRCRANKAARYQQSKQAALQSRQAIAQAKAPVYVPSVPVQPAQPITAPLRKALYQMSEAELETWTKSIETALLEMQARNAAYTARAEHQPYALDEHTLIALHIAIDTAARELGVQEQPLYKDIVRS